jgi:DNA-binding FadR family transcriptional regulator
LRGAAPALPTRLPDRPKGVRACLRASFDHNQRMRRAVIDDRGGDDGVLRLHGTIARDLGIQIASGVIRPGDILDGEIAASGMLNVSRTAYREAVRILSAKGLVTSRPKVGTRVSPREQWHLLDPDVLGWIFGAKPDESLLDGLFELRRIIEPEAASLAAQRRTEAHVETMRASLEDMAVHTLGTEAGRSADQQFHAALLDASGNPFLSSLTSGVAAAVAWTTIFKQRLQPLRRDALPDHRKVFDAVAARDAAGAHAAMAQLVDLALSDTRKARDEWLAPA